MSEKLKALWGKVKERLKKISKKIWIAAAVLLVILAAVLVIILNNRPYAVLFTGMSTSETSSVVSYLDSAGIKDYKVQNNDTILVPESQVENLKVSLLLEGYPQTGYAYSTYDDRISSLSTESERENAYLMFLQESLSNTIRSFENVKDATVYVTPGEDNSYVLDSGNVVNATASVLVEMSGTARLTSEQAAAIRNLVSHAVQGLEVDSVAIEDTMGNSYTADAAASAGDMSALKLQLEEENANKIRTEVMQALIPAYGEDHVRVSVNCVVDISQRTVNSRDVYLPEWAEDGETDGRGIIGSEVYSYYVGRPDGDVVGGLVGSETNSDLSEYVEDLSDPDGDEDALAGSSQKDYDNSYQETEAVYIGGELADCSVAVTIDAATAGIVDTAAIQRHVARAAGIVGVVDEETGEEYLDDKISVIVTEFYSEEEPSDGAAAAEPLVPLWVLAAAAGGLLLFVILLIVILLIRRRRRKKKEEKQRQELDAMLAAAGLEQAPAPEGADVMTLQTEKSMELRKDIRQFATENPEIAAQMVRNWLKGGDTNG